MADYHRQAIELARNNDWDASHRLIQAYDDPLACLIHGYLHRLEGDLWNARYWYNRAGESMPDNSPEEELERLAARSTE